MDVLRNLTLLLATLSMGLICGVYFLYAHTIMPGLAKTDDRTFVDAFTAMDRKIISPVFMLTSFMGALVLSLIAGLLQLGREPFVWIAAAFVLYLLTVIITIAVNVPRNDAMKAAGDVDRIDLPGVRAAFDEARWRRSNNIRVVLNLAAFALLGWALVVEGSVA